MSAVWNCPSCEAANPPAVRICEGCGYERPAPAPSVGVLCRCGEALFNHTPFYDDGAPEDAGRLLCPSCWMLALKRRAELDPLSPEQRVKWRALVLGGALPRATESTPL